LALKLLPAPFGSKVVFCLLGEVMSDRFTRRFGLRISHCAIPSMASGLMTIFLAPGSQIHSAQLAGFILSH
jgi:hypothetical protein